MRRALFLAQCTRTLIGIWVGSGSIPASFTHAAEIDLVGERPIEVCHRLTS
ncbi:MAG: hypothetical protein ACYC9S_05890 [Leptospirales bacterium]